MRDAAGLAPPAVRRHIAETSVLRRYRLAPVLLALLLVAAAACYAVPRGWQAGTLLSVADDPNALADRALDEKFNSEVANREIAEALAAKDTDLAKSFADLAGDRHIAIDAGLDAQVKTAVANDATASHAAQSFALGLVTGEPSDMAGLAGTTLGDLFVFGDIRDAVREGTRYATGQKTDTLILGLACVGLAITAGTYATLGAASPARLGLSLAKVARKTGKLSGELAGYIGRALRRVVDGDQLKKAATGMSIAQPTVAIRAARDAVKVERAGGLVDLARDVGRVQGKAGTQAALDGLKLAGTPREMARVAQLAAKQGGKSRAILKIAGRAAITLTVGAFNLTLWVLGALVTLFGVIASCKGVTERATMRFLHKRKLRRLERQIAQQGQMA